MLVTLRHQTNEGAWVKDFTCDFSDPKLTTWVNTYNRNDVVWTVIEESA